MDTTLWIHQIGTGVNTYRNVITRGYHPEAAEANLWTGEWLDSSDELGAILGWPTELVDRKGNYFYDVIGVKDAQGNVREVSYTHLTK